MAEQVLLFNRQPDRPLTFEEYRQLGGYEALTTALKKNPEELRQTVLAAGLRGRGGAGFPTGKKWSFIGKGQPRYLVPNTDEMEPGTFKDRVLVNVNPHLVLSATGPGPVSRTTAHAPQRPRARCPRLACRFLPAVVSAP